MTIVFCFPGACSRVTMTALEEIGAPYEDRVVNIRESAQKSADYLRVNPKGKVPALEIDGKVMTENAAILHFLHRRNPAAKLLPHDADPVLDNQGLIDLVWCSGTIHPIVRQIRMPVKWTSGDPAGVRADGLEKFARECAAIAGRIGEAWWYGDQWSIIDTYLYWAYSTARRGGFALEDYPALLDHAERVRARPAFQRVLARETAAVERYAIADVVL
ncbi:glutathione S-transferase family protein [Novosphingobium terrae]|uniref:glutathione S-transferase family protein n=1 Tax=Novosphingobium terrae TaxID=2726189 RepID=UPI0019811D52|nr:glutathione S-transferase family protein [Novosphingobium terrae]